MSYFSIGAPPLTSKFICLIYPVPSTSFPSLFSSSSLNYLTSTSFTSSNYFAALFFEKPFVDCRFTSAFAFDFESEFTFKFVAVVFGKDVTVFLIIELVFEEMRFFNEAVFDSLC